MKNLILFVLAISPLFLTAQTGEWMQGKALTDSSHNNRNVCAVQQLDGIKLFWDQELNPTTTQLCFNSLNSIPADAQIALSIPGVKLTNPKILDLNPYSQPSTFLVLFQTNQGKDTDLKSMRYQADGTFTDPVILSNLPGDDINLTCSLSGTVAWENSGKIWVSQYLQASNSFSEPFAIDSAGAYSPVFEPEHYLNYLKPNGDSTFIISEYVYSNQGNWIIIEKETKSIDGKGSALSSSGPNWYGSLALQNKTGTNPSGLIVFSNRLSDTEYRNSPTFNLSHPTIEEYMIGTKGNFGFHFLAYVSDSLIQNEIFVETPYGYYWGPQNISQNPGDDRNPQFSVTFHSPATIRVTLFWESERQGFYTIYTSYYDYLFGAIDENPKAESIIVKPCPFDRQTTIRFQADGKTNVRIFDLQGREVKKLLPQKDADGSQSAVWDGTNNYGNSVPSGNYLIVAGSGNEAQSRIVIKK